MITYCTNIHPAEDWIEVLAGLEAYVVPVKAAVSPHEPFPVGLRLSARAADEIDDGESEKFLDWLAEHGCYIPTINGFPYEAFHRSGLKEDVYLPDWRSAERVRYSLRLADLLGKWLPEGMTGSVSTVPVGFRDHVRKEDCAAVRRNLLSVLEHLDRIRQDKGRDIVLSLEPEPGCVLETTAEAAAFLEAMDFPDDLRRGVGICLDCCHQAVEFESPRECLTTLGRAGVRIGKVQVSSGLRFVGSETGRAAGWAEPYYLHQVVAKGKDGALYRYNDIPDALADRGSREDDEWRIHFHVPVNAERTESSGTTRFFVEEVVPLLPPGVLLEVETYTWKVLPEEERVGSVTESIVREIEWVRSVESSREASP